MPLIPVSISVRRRAALRGFGAAALAAPLSRLAVAAPAAPLRLVQPLDPAADEQELVRDYAAGVQSAVRALNTSGGVAGREVQVQTVNCAASPADAQALLRRLQADASVLGLVGSAGERLSQLLVQGLVDEQLPLPLVAPWLSDSRHDQAPQVAQLFASREVQLRKTLASLDAMGLRQLGVVYDSAATRAVVQPSLAGALQRLQLQAPSWTAADGQVEALARQLPASSPPLLAFAGGTLELSRFAQALAARGLVRYLVSLGTADAGLLVQTGAARSVPLVLTQVVPNPRNAQAEYARRFREAYGRYFDDAPSPAGLAGYLAGRYTLRLLSRLGSGTRAALLDEVRRRSETDLDGYAVRFEGGRGSQFVTQTLIGRDGRLIG